MYQKSQHAYAASSAAYSNSRKQSSATRLLVYIGARPGGVLAICLAIGFRVFRV